MDSYFVLPCQLHRCQRKSPYDVITNKTRVGAIPCSIPSLFLIDLDCQSRRRNHRRVPRDNSTTPKTLLRISRNGQKKRNVEWNGRHEIITGASLDVETASSFALPAAGNTELDTIVITLLSVFGLYSWRPRYRQPEFEQLVRGGRTDWMEDR